MPNIRRPRIEATGSLENSAPVLFDAVVLPDGAPGIERLAAHGRVLEFIANQYRHGKPLLALGASKSLLDMAAIFATLPSGEVDTGVLLAEEADFAAAGVAIIEAVARHRHPARESDPPRV